MKINLKVRFKNPMFYVQLILAIFAPILAYMGLTASDITTWSTLFNVILKAINNPYVLFLVIESVYIALVDPTTSGFGDSDKALSYDRPNK